MSVPTETSQQDFTGNGVTTDFSCDFPVTLDTDLLVTLTLDGEDEATTLTLGVDYDVLNYGDLDDPTCLVRMADPPANLSTLHIERLVPLTQERALRTEGDFSPEVHERAFDKLTEICQQLQRRIAALEALGTLVPIGDFEALLLDVHIHTDADEIEDTFSGGKMTVALPVGFAPTGCMVAKVVNVTNADAVLEEAVFVDWSVAADTLTLRYVTGLDVATHYVVTLMLVSIEPT